MAKKTKISAKAAPKAPMKERRAVPRPGSTKTMTKSARDKAVAGRKGDMAAQVIADAARGKYVYCVIQSADSRKFGAAGIGDNGSEIHTIHYRDLAAVVSDVEEPLILAAEVSDGLDGAAWRTLAAGRLDAGPAGVDATGSPCREGLVVDPRVEPLDCQVLDSADARRAGGHLPIMARLRLPATVI